MTKIVARSISYKNEGDHTILAFADSADSPSKYVLLQISNDPDEEELEFGWGGIHIDTGLIGVEGYDLVEDIKDTPTGLVVRISADAAHQARISRNIELGFKRNDIDGIPLDEIIRNFTSRLSPLDDHSTG